ncbi:MAG: DUF1553 domain-containing protein [Planctomycetes bacterium]|nr:DUF1553 domain-containing protein [Planctomycetota bacterium]MCW8136725.1 DUF1553 domain-containing protein [Planctomycetota bacterium]
MRLTALFGLAAAVCALLAFQSFAAADDPAPDHPDRKTEAKPDPVASEANLTAAIDAEIAKLLARDGITRAPVVGDEEFVRRLYLDVTGMPPTLDETLAFLGSDDPAKRGKLIDALVADQRFADHVTDQWLNVLAGRGRAADNADMLLGAWMSSRIHEGRGFDAIIYDILTAEGKMSENPAASYFGARRELRTPDVAGEAARHFTGVQIQCAQCHDHPYEEAWKETDFNGVASFFSTLRLRRQGDMRPRQAIIGDQKVRIMEPAQMQRRLAGITDNQQRVREYEGMRYRAPKYLLGERVRADSDLWRKAWAKWVIAKDNTQTQRYLANRHWSFLFGMGLLNPVDDFNSINEASHPELLDLLANDLRDNGYDLRRFYRAVLKSRTWQSASSGAQREQGNIENWHFARYPVRQLSPEQFFGALMVLGGHAQRQQSRIRARANPYEREKAEAARYLKQKEEGKLPENRRVIDYDLEALDKMAAIIDSMSPGWYLRRQASRNYASISSDDEMTEADSFTLTIDQALLLMNGNATFELSQWGKGTLLEFIAQAGNSAARVERMFLLALSRKPTEEESKRFQAFVLQSRNEQQAWEDALYALLLTSEFGTNH